MQPTWEPPIVARRPKCAIWADPRQRLISLAEMAEGPEILVGAVAAGLAPYYDSTT
jgi:hypothetical protein